MRAADPRLEAARPREAGQDPCEAASGAGSPLEQALTAAAAAAESLPEGPLKRDRLETLALLGDLRALLDAGDQVIGKTLELLRLQDPSTGKDHHAGR